MRVAILGGGLQGCCAALALGERGMDVVLFDRNDAILSRTAVANEGKIHLGYMYAGDPSLSTARIMMKGALAFAPFMHRHLGIETHALATSVPAAYVVHRDSQHSAQAVEDYLRDVHELIVKASTGREFDYFGLDISAPPRAWTSSERDTRFNPDAALAAFDTPEVAINPVALASVLRRAIADHRRIEVRHGHQVSKVDSVDDRLCVTSEKAGFVQVDAFDHVVNALWDGRLAIDATMGLKPTRPWLHRLKYGISFTLPDGLERPPSATFVSGPFGEVVSYPDRLTYLTWYPECIHGYSTEVTPPVWDTFPPEPLRTKILTRTIAAMTEIVPSLAAVDAANLPDALVKGGLIVAWGETDIYDTNSELHQRYQIGITSKGNYHSIDPGKLTMAPYFADQCATRIAGDV
ncbi:FAD-binding oxidoreductase [Mesorhizobium sp. M7A.F.Ca.US.001.01.1.1]|uniref:FAD-dependent oxidoreductase n=1 Tax=Mesorhizobium sp. WSM1293 TaxID=1040984 RepID=UPI0004ACEF7E|nr:FAD-dependent oxidoreductase [Mesorhizobium sp. WSM1293]RVA58697.1 FAD-binding oxidoreductase [Mesorhizobium sp. M7A.F.Ca.US.001.01.1.1]